MLPLPPRCAEVIIRGIVLERLVPVEAVLDCLFGEGVATGMGRTLRLYAQHAMTRERMVELIEALSRVTHCASPVWFPDQVGI